MITQPLWVPLQYGMEKPVFAAGLPVEIQDLVFKCLDVWAMKLARNQLRYRYYDGKNRLKDLEISIPPQLRDLEVVVGWPQKAVDELAVRSRFDGFTASNTEVQTILDELSEVSQLERKWQLAAQSTLIHSCSFPTFGVDESGRPRIDLHSAETAAAVWDNQKGTISYGITIDQFDDGVPVALTLHTQEFNMYTWYDGAVWQWEIYPFDLGRGDMETFVYRPTIRKPFGQSRISRAVMAITDSAVRESLRTEISAEFFTSPQKYLLGADKQTFAKVSKWEAYIGNIFAVGRDKNGDLPQFGQLSQGTMQPHVDYMRSLAAQFSGATNVPISTLGIIHDNPSSAEAIYAAAEPLIIEAEDFNQNARWALRQLALMAIATALDKRVDELTAEEREFTVNFKSPAMPSVVSQADAMVKIASVVPEFAGTSTFFEQMGFGEDTRARVKNEIARNNAAFTLSNVLNSERLNNVSGGGV